MKAKKQDPEIIRDDWTTLKQYASEGKKETDFYVGSVLTRDMAIAHLTGVVAINVMAMYKPENPKFEPLELVHHVMMQFIDSESENIVRFLSMREFVIEKPFAELTEFETKGDAHGQGLFQGMIWKIIGMAQYEAKKARNMKATRDNLGSGIKYGSSKRTAPEEKPPTASVRVVKSMAPESTPFVDEAYEQLQDFIESLPELQRIAVNREIFSGGQDEIDRGRSSRNLYEARKKLKKFVEN